MIDLHNHLLPGVDDGARDMGHALRMLEIAVSQGITHVACTPHGNDRANEKTDRLYQSVFARLQEWVAEHGLPVKLILGSELMLGADIFRVLALPFATYGGQGKYFLVEFPTETPYEIIVNVVRSARRRDLWPVLAHFERFPRAQKSKEHVALLKSEGAVLTLDAGALTGQFGPEKEKRARQLLEWKVVDILASDAHDDENHGFRLREGYDVAANVWGEETARKMVWDNPLRVWEGAPWPEPVGGNRVQ